MNLRLNNVDESQRIWSIGSRHNRLKWKSNNDNSSNNNNGSSTLQARAMIPRTTTSPRLFPLGDSSNYLHNLLSMSCTWFATAQTSRH